ncbi:MAG: hypothetical protein ABIA04_09420 [Pseudomonadota bacterium]
MSNKNTLPHRLKLIPEDLGKIKPEGYFTEIQIKKYNRDNYNIYYFVNEVKVPRGIRNAKNIYVKKINALFVDCDLKDYLEDNKVNQEKYPGATLGKLIGNGKQYYSKKEFLDEVRKFHLQPSKIVDSGYGIHIYWHLKNTPKLFPVDDFAFFQQALANYFNTDPVKDPVRVMRYPGTYNVKYNRNKLVKYINKNCDENLRYSYDDFYKIFYNEIIELQNSAKKRGRPKKPLKIDNITVSSQLPRSFANILKIKPKIWKLFKCIGDKYANDTSKADYALSCKLITNSFCYEDIYSILANAPKVSNKDSRYIESYINNTISKAAAEIDIEIPLKKHGVKRRGGSAVGHRVNIVTTPPILRCVITRPSSRNKRKKLHVISAFRKRISSEELYIILDNLINNPKPGACEIIPEHPGSGKSAAIINLCLQIRHQNRGAIIVKERKEDLYLLEKDLNNQDHVFCLVGHGDVICEKKILNADKLYSPCKGCSIKRCSAHPTKFKEQYKYPILLMTKKRFQIETFSGNGMKNFINYISGGTKGKREFLFIDENPDLIANSHFSQEQVINFLSKLGDLFHGKEESKIPTILNSLNKLNRHIDESKNTNTGVIEINPHELELSFDKKEKDKLIEKYNNKAIELIDKLNILNEHGGLLFSKIRESDNKTINIVYPDKRFSLNQDELTTLLFDGTATLDPSYLKYDINPVGKIKSFKNLYFHIQDKQVCKSNLSNQNTKNHYIPKILNDIRAIQMEQPDKRLFVVTTVSDGIEDEIKEEIKELNLKNIRVNHYQNLRGSNEYSKSTLIYFTHINQKSIEYYISYASAIYGRNNILKEDLSGIDKQGSGGRRGFKSSKLETIRCQEIVTDLIQCIFRTKLRVTEDEDIHVYIGIEDLTILYYLFEYFEDAKVYSWHP